MAKEAPNDLWVNVYPSDECSYNVEEFAHTTPEAAARNLNPGNGKTYHYVLATPAQIAAHADGVRVLSDEEEALVDKACGLVKMVTRVSADMYEDLKQQAEDLKLPVPALVRNILTKATVDEFGQKRSVKPAAEPVKEVAYWPWCEKCHKPFDFDQEGPFAYCGCGTTEWGYPRPFPWVEKPSSLL